MIARRFCKKNILQTSFFVIDAKLMERCVGNDFIVKVARDDQILLMLHYADYPAVLLGEKSLCDEMAKEVAQKGFSFCGINCEPNLGETVFWEYEKLQGGSHVVKLDMRIMHCTKAKDCDVSGVRWVAISYAPRIAKMIAEFEVEALGNARDSQKILNSVTACIERFALAEANGQAVSVACFAQSTETLCRVYDVYTLPSYRNRGLSKKVVTFLKQHILQKGCKAMLYVDNTNPISNRLYSSIGYRHLDSQCLFEYEK